MSTAAGTLHSSVQTATVTVGHLRQLLRDLPASSEVCVGVFDNHHVEALLGSLPVTTVQIMPNAHTPEVVLRVAGLS